MPLYDWCPLFLSDVESVGYEQLVVEDEPTAYSQLHSFRDGVPTWWAEVGTLISKVNVPAEVIR